MSGACLLGLEKAISVAVTDPVQDDRSRRSDLDHIERHHRQVHTSIDPTQSVPLGPGLSGLTSPHGRDDLGGRPFGDGTPPGPPPADEVIARQL